MATPGGDRIACALASAQEYTEVCVVERSREGGMLRLVVHHPDGKFRRFDVLDDGRGLVVADGADQAVSRLVGDHAEIEVKDDRYRFPVTVKSHDAIQ